MPLLGAGNSAINKTDKNSCPSGWRQKVNKTIMVIKILEKTDIVEGGWGAEGVAVLTREASLMTWPLSSNLREGAQWIAREESSGGVRIAGAKAPVGAC